MTWSSAPSEVAKQIRFLKTLEDQRITSDAPIVAASSRQEAVASLLLPLQDASDEFIGAKNPSSTKLD
jgi:hypothetical protein